MKCNICGNDEASNYTWSEEMLCNAYVEWLHVFMHDFPPVYDFYPEEVNLHDYFNSGVYAK